jgi:N-acetylglucosaminyldiphosphoundecaprenol N-acetyl-beta-D-mannosaminyltransferase
MINKTRRYSSSVNICGIKVDNCSLSDALKTISRYIEEITPRIIVTCNVDHIVKLKQDAEFMKVYKTASLVVPDGVPLLWAAKILGHPLIERVNGTDLFERMCEIAAKKNIRVYFLGGRPGACESAAEFFKRKYPEINIVGLYSPSFGFECDDEENKKIVNMIKAANPDLLFVGLGAPKQEKWIYKYHKEYAVPVSIGIGVSFELSSGMVMRAPKWMQRTGLEWFWRFMMEPRRLWKRYFVNDPKFIWFVLKQKMRLE